MSNLGKMATIFAKEMIEHNLEHGAVRLDVDFIAEQACDLAYKINEKLKSYGDSDSKDDIDEKIEKKIKELIPNQHQNHTTQYHNPM